jgi:copper resistance protein D
VIESAIIALRLLQYIGAMILFGSSLFFAFSLPASGPASAAHTPGAKRLVGAAAAIAALAAALSVGAQASLFTGSISDGFTVEGMTSVVSFMGLGKAAVVRTVAAAIALIVLLVLRPRRSVWLSAAGLGAIATASLVWMGHGAVTEGPMQFPHLASDVIHALAAGAWLGALAAFFLLLMNRQPTVAQGDALYNALRRFSGTGTAIVGLVLLTGLVNSWVLVGPNEISHLWSTPYGRLLVFKLGLFLAMLGLAAANRFRLTPALAASAAQGNQAQALARLRRSIALETTAAFMILALVGWLGTLEPPSA